MNIFIIVIFINKKINLIFRDTLDVVKQSAALCLLRLFRTDPNIIPSGEWTSRIIHLLNDQHMGVVTAVSYYNGVNKQLMLLLFFNFLK